MMEIESVKAIVLVVMGLSLVLGIIIGAVVGGYDTENKPKTKKVKSLEQLADKELFALQMAVFNEIARRGAEMIKPFDDLEK